jgi:thiol-disulfide isomerase/thioredoxin
VNNRRGLVVGGAVALCLAALVGAWALFEGKSGPPLAWPDPLKDPQVRALLRSECELAGREGRPLLVEFSAPWCEHCQAVKQALQSAELRRSLEGFRTVVLNIGNDDELDAVRRELEARAIPAWVVVRPGRCNAEPKEWKRLGNTYPKGEVGGLREFLEAFRGG